MCSALRASVCIEPGHVRILRPRRGYLFISSAPQEKTLNELVLDGWLISGPSKSFKLGVRTFLELRQMLGDMELPEATRNLWTNLGLIPELELEAGE